MMSLAMIFTMAFALVAAALPSNRANAQADAVPVRIYPISRATFLPGARFDFQVETALKELPADFKITINGDDPAKLFSVAAKNETWQTGTKEKPVDNSAVTFRQVTLPKAGDYKVEVVSGGKTTTATWNVMAPQAGKGKNVILFIADGMTTAQITAARLMSKGVKDGKLTGTFSFDKFSSIGLVSTNSVDSIMADSANTASALNTGHKSSVNATGVYANTSPDLYDDPRVETFAEMLRRTRNMAIGVVTTSDWTDATPAAVWAHGRNRSDPVRQYFATSALDEGLKPDVIMGGGSARMIPKATAGSRRTDERNVIADYEKAGYTVVTNKTELTAAMAKAPKSVMGLFQSSDMNVWLDRNVYKDNAKNFPDQPGLVDMTVSALDVLKTNPNGFYLEVEAASVDKQMHPMDWDRALADLIEFERSVAAAVEWTSKNAPDTLIVVTADHGHGFDVYGTVDVAKFNAGKTDLEKRDAIRVYNLAGFPGYVDANGDGYPDDFAPSIVFAAGVNNGPDHTEDFQVSKVPRVPAVCKPNEQQKTICVDNPDDDAAGIPQPGNLDPASGSGVHTLQDVPLYATGPGAAWFTRHMEQSDVFFGMAYALGLDPSAKDGKVAAAANVLGTSDNQLGTVVLALVIGLSAGLLMRRKPVAA